MNRRSRLLKVEAVAGTLRRRPQMLNFEGMKVGDLLQRLCEAIEDADAVLLASTLVFRHT
jgi:hypothetical protein